ncbi:hypothetical protein HanIR_Chr06g0267921 [Helianthus annuus]|nr:hypothetical protein HanIR_Chr06g0267921 [Helianthus annuus]
MAEFCKNITLQLNQTHPVLEFIKVNASSLVDVCIEIKTEDKYSEPMVVIGWYITMALFICLCAMNMDLIHGIGLRKFWFPCDCFSLNAASLTVITVAMKLVVDLSSPMTGWVDQAAKVGGLGYLCVMMSNLMPSLASMDNNSLLANVTGLSILVITLIVNVSIQIKTHVISSEYPFMTTTCIYMGSMNRLIHHAERDKRNNLLKILEKSVAFHGVETFDTDQIHSLLDVELVNSWSLPIVSLACIAISIPNIHMGEVSNLFQSVVAGIGCTHIVEESLNKASEYVNIRRATVMLWKEIAYKYKWLNHSLKRSAYEGKSATEIIKLFAHRAEDILNEFNTSTNRKRVEKENLPLKVIAANSMYRIAKTIMHTYESNNLEITEDELFSRLSVMIADILAACFTNIPRVIIMKCRESAIEKRENSVRDAIRFFGRTTEIIKILETRELPNMDPEKMGFIEEWRLHLKQP